MLPQINFQVTRAFSGCSIRYMSGRTKDRQGNTQIVPSLHGKKVMNKRKDRTDGSNSHGFRKGDLPNPFLGNVGAGRTMKALGFESPDDPALTYIFEGHGDFTTTSDPRVMLEELHEHTNDYKRQMKLKNDFTSKYQLKRLLTKKNFFPDRKDPEILLWSEKLTIWHLHKTDPGEWTLPKLMEAFPQVTQKMLKDLLKNRSPSKMSLEEAKLHDEEVRRNWKDILTGGITITISDGFRKHLLEVGSSLLQGIEQRKYAHLTQTNVKELKETMMIQFRGTQEVLSPVRPKSIKGPFGAIISDYKNKVDAKHLVMTPPNDHNTSSMNTAIAETKGLLVDGDKSWDGLQKPARDPRRGTSLLNADINLRLEKPMTMETFQQKYLEPSLKKQMNSKVNKTKKVEAGDPCFNSSTIQNMAKQFLTWLEVERIKDNRTKVENVHKSIHPDTRLHSRFAGRQRKTSFGSSITKNTTHIF